MKIKTDDNTEIEFSIIAASLVVAAVCVVTKNVVKTNYNRWSMKRFMKKNDWPKKAKDS